MKSRSRDAKPNRTNRNNKSILAATVTVAAAAAASAARCVAEWSNQSNVFLRCLFFFTPFSLISLIMIFSLVLADKFRLKAATTKNVTVWQLHQINRFDHHSHSQCNSAFCSQNICLFFSVLLPHFWWYSMCNFVLFNAPIWHQRLSLPWTLFIAHPNASQTEWHENYQHFR